MMKNSIDKNNFATIKHIEAKITFMLLMCKAINFLPNESIFGKIKIIAINEDKVEIFPMIEIKSE